MLVIDGAYGEGGGQILRTSLSMAALLNRSICIKNIRARRKTPGLAAQHLTAVRAAAMICRASLSGDHLGSTELTFEPQGPVVPGLYEFDVAEARTGGSAGAATLVLQTVLLPLALAQGPSSVRVRGGTHVPWSPSFHYLQDIYLPLLALLGIQATAELLAWGWYPAGEGAIKLDTPGYAAFAASPEPWPWLERGALKQVTGVAVASSLPSHIAQRISDRAAKLLKQTGFPTAIKPVRAQSTSPGAGIFLMVEYEMSRAGFGVLGRKGKPSEQVAEEAVEAALAFHRSGAFIDEHLADQLILPVALTGYPVVFSTPAISQHTLTNIWVVEQFLGPTVRVDQKSNLVEFTSRTGIRTA
jgi:RNA 3'-terminal phosphate cyclase (ATP)